MRATDGQLWSCLLSVATAVRTPGQDRAEIGEGLRMSPPSSPGFLPGLSLLILKENADPRKAPVTLSMLGGVLLHT